MNSEIIKKFCDLLGEERVFTGEAMSRHTTFKIGGPADYFLMPDKGEDVGRVIKICKEKEIPYFERCAFSGDAGGVYPHQRIRGSYPF